MILELHTNYYMEWNSQTQKKRFLLISHALIDALQNSFHEEKTRNRRKCKTTSRDEWTNGVDFDVSETGRPFHPAKRNIIVRLLFG